MCFVLLIIFSLIFFFRLCPICLHVINLLRNKTLPNTNSSHATNNTALADMKANNYEVAEAGETITFRGLVARSTSQAFFLTFCTALGMASLALVLQIQFQDVG